MGLEAAATVLQLLFNDSPADLRFTRVTILLVIRTLLSKVAWQTMRTCGRGQHPGRMSRVGGGHNGEKNFIALFHVSEHSEHFKSILKN